MIGKDSEKLSDKWTKAMRTLHGMFTDDFPNCYFVGHTQTTASPNFVYVFEKLAEHVAAVISHAVETGAEVAEATPDAVEGWVKTIDDSHGGTKAFLSKCTLGQNNNEGDLDDPDATANRLYGGGCEAFIDIFKNWREDGEFEGINFE